MKKEKKLYAFEELHDFMDKKGYPKVPEVARLSDFNMENLEKFDSVKLESNHNVTMDNEGIYFTIKGVNNKGYLYLKNPIIKGSDNKYPVAHIRYCTTLEEQEKIKKKYFKKDFVFGNTEEVVVCDRSDNFKEHKVKLDICKNCTSSIDSLRTTEDFRRRLEVLNESSMKKKLESSLFFSGYTDDFSEISKAFRGYKNYLCNRCRVDLSSNIRYLHVHHVDRNKKNNSIDNLEALCILCHTVEHDFKKDMLKSLDLKVFCEEFREEVKQCNSENLLKYERHIRTQEM